MAAVDRLNYKKVQRSYYNVNMYNDTTDIIPAKFSISTIIPLLHNPDQYEVAVCRCSVPLDGIPISQRDIPYGEWAIMVEDAHAQPPNSNVAVVAQFGALIPTITYINQPNTFAISDGTNNYRTGYIDVATNQFVYSNSTLVNNGVFQCTTPNYAYTLFTPGLNTTISQMNLTTFVSTSYPFMGLSATDTVIGMCADVDKQVYLLIIDNSDNLKIYQWDFISTAFIADVIVFTLGGGFGQTTINTFNVQNSGNSIKYLNLVIFSSAIEIHIVKQYTFTGDVLNDTSYTTPIYPETAGYISLQLMGSAFYVLGYYANGVYNLARYNTGSNAVINVITYSSANAIYGAGTTLIISIDNTYNLIYKISNANGIYTTHPTTNVPVYLGTAPYNTQYTMSMFYTTQSSITTYSGNIYYPIWTIQDYVNKINTALLSAFTAVFPPGNPQQPSIPYLSYSNAKFSMNVPASFTADSDYSISFNTRLGRRFLFNTKPGVVLTGVNPITTLTENFYPLQLLEENPNEENPITQIFNYPQPNSTAYKFFDITRIIIGSTKLSVAGDTELSNTSLLNITDFAVDTTSPNVLLQIYEPAILRYYQMYQTAPLTMLDAFLQYATKDGNIYNINLIPGESASMKLLFRRSNLQITKF